MNRTRLVCWLSLAAIIACACSDDDGNAAAMNQGGAAAVGAQNNAGAGGASGTTGGAAGANAGASGAIDSGLSSSDGGGEGGGDAQTDAGDDGGLGTVYPQPGQRTGPGVLPAQTAGPAEYLGTLVYDDPNIVRDLGYSGVVNGQIVWTFGDTLVANGSGGFAFAASDSAALGELLDPLKVHDKSLDENGRPEEWIPLNADELGNGGLNEFAMGGTNVVEHAPNQGLVWFLKNHRGGGSDNIVGAGVATVTADENGPIAVRMSDTMWGPNEPYWGDIGVTYDPRDEHVYVFGHGPSSLDLKANTYLAKVPADQATNVEAYSYWDRSSGTWTSQRFGDGEAGTLAISSDQAIFTFASHGQSNAFWSNHYNTWMFVHGADWGDSEIYVSTAPELQGPWSAGVAIGTTCPPSGECGSLRYCIAPHPEFDPSGKTLLVTWTDSNVIHAVRFEWQ